MEMNKEEIQKKLDTIYKKCLGEDLYDISDALQKAFNLGLEIAAGNGKATYDYLGDEKDLNFYYENIIPKVIKDSILKYKL